MQPLKHRNFFKNQNVNTHMLAAKKSRKKSYRRATSKTVHGSGRRKKTRTKSYRGTSRRRRSPSCKKGALYRALSNDDPRLTYYTVTGGRVPVHLELIDQQRWVYFEGDDDESIPIEIQPTEADVLNYYYGKYTPTTLSTSFSDFVTTASINRQTWVNIYQRRALYSTTTERPSNVHRVPLQTPVPRSIDTDSLPRYYIVKISRQDENIRVSLYGGQGTNDEQTLNLQGLFAPRLVDIIVMILADRGIPEGHDFPITTQMNTFDEYTFSRFWPESVPPVRRTQRNNLGSLYRIHHQRSLKLETFPVPNIITDKLFEDINVGPYPPSTDNRIPGMVNTRRMGKNLRSFVPDSPQVDSIARVCDFSVDEKSLTLIYCVLPK